MQEIEVSNADLKAESAFLRGISQRAADGQLRFSPEEVIDVIMLAALQQMDDDPTPQQLQLLSGVVLPRLGLSAESSPEQCRHAVTTYFADRPVRADLVTAVHAALRAIEAEGGELSRKARDLIGAAESQRPVGAGERPAGSLAGGVLAQLGTQTKD